ncbi:hypothetical protein FRC03_011448 [Tulasnella sp. 419]|nr:hypothetical protein FRC03_011448 [Tulasnella sp. 419]
MAVSILLSSLGLSLLAVLLYHCVRILIDPFRHRPLNNHIENMPSKVTTSTSNGLGAQPRESKVDVLVIGAGPAGLMCANGLARAGVNVKIVDKKASKVDCGHADGIQPRSIEVLQSYGLAERLIKEGNQMHMTAFYNPSPNGGIERSGRAPDVTAPTARHPFEITLHQGAIENIFKDSMSQYGVEVQRPWQPEALTISCDEKELLDPQAYPVTVILRRLKTESSLELDDVEIVRAKYVVGADGAHSWVRKSLGFTMDGEQTDFVWGVVDSVPDTNFPDIRNRTAIHSNNGSCMIIPREGDVVRLYVQLSEVEVGSAGRIDKSKWNPERVMEVARKSMAPYTISFPNPILWWTIYMIGQRVASQFSAHERVFIAGDACHTHSPKAGQGMNASMNDTHNLVWKLVHVLRGWAKHSLLKTYEQERRKYAQDLIAFDKKFSALFSGKPKSVDNEDGVTHDEFLKVFQTFGQFTSGIGIHYQESDIVDPTGQCYAPYLRIGQRCIPQIILRAADCRPYEIQDLLVSDTRFKLLIFCGDLTQDFQLERIQAFADALDQDKGFLKRCIPAGVKEEDVFDFITIASTKKEEVEYTVLPQRLRSHWTKVYVDDVSVAGGLGGKAYETYGISPNGAVIVIRPDGYVGMMTGLNKWQVIENYFSAFFEASRA